MNIAFHNVKNEIVLTVGKCEQFILTHCKIQLLKALLFNKDAAASNSAPECIVNVVGGRGRGPA